MKNFENLKWEHHSRIVMETYYLITDVTILNNKPFYRHTKITRTANGYGVGKSSVKYSKTLESKDITENAVRKLMEIAETT